jgi:hypothetical protein
MNKKRIGNIGTLDLRETRPEALDNIEWIDNVGAVLVSKETEGLLSKLAVGNMGGSSIVPKDCKLIDGELALSHGFFAAGNSVNALINGTMKIETDVTRADLENGMTFLAVNGTVFCPHDLIPIVQSKADFIRGRLIPLEDNAKVLMGKHEINHAFCQTLHAPTRLILVGEVDLTGVLSADDVTNIDMLEIVGNLKIAEENLQLLGEKLAQSPTLHIGLTIPAGYTYIKQPLTLNNATLQRFDKAKLFTRHRLTIEKDVSAEALQQAISHLCTSDYVICPEGLQSTLLAISDVTAEKLLSFSEELIVVEGKHTLMAAELKYRPPRFSLLVDGKLRVADDVAPDEFFQRVEHIYNFGKIIASEEICGILHVKSKTRKGSIKNQNAPEESKLPVDPETYLVQNTGYLKL